MTLVEHKVAWRRLTTADGVAVDGENGLPVDDDVARQLLADLLAKQFTLNFRSADQRPDEIRYAQRLTSSATLIPATGNAFRIRKIGWVPYDDPNTVTLRWADVGAGVRNIWQANATQQTVYETGDVDRALEIVLFNGKPIDVNVHYEEITP